LKKGKKQEGNMPEEGVTVTHAHKWKDDRQISQRGMMTIEKKKLKIIKGMNKGEQLRQLASCRLKVLKNGRLHDMLLKVFITST
jgi:hypothetical protein